jgi:hypothetical protein
MQREQLEHVVPLLCGVGILLFAISPASNRNILALTSTIPVVQAQKLTPALPSSLVFSQPR